MADNNSNKENEKPSKRFRKPAKQLGNKLKREKGLEYETVKGKKVPAKCFKAILCKCLRSCHFTVNEKVQKEIFQHFYSLNSWTKKTAFLLNHIEITDCKTRRRAEKRKNIQFKKSISRFYFLTTKEEKVCKSFFKKVLQISEGRIEHCMKKKQNLNDSCGIDRRGKHLSHKKTSHEAIQSAVEFIRNIPQYESHYTRKS